MDQLTIGELEKKIKYLKKHLPDKYKDIKVYLSDDDELNGIHCAWFTNIVVSTGLDEDTKYLNEMVTNNLREDEKLDRYYVLLS